MIKYRWLAIPALSALGFVLVWAANVEAQAPSQVALYCRGPLSTFRADGGKTIRTPFKWAKEAAGKENPGPGECAYVDRKAEASENAVMMGNLGPFDNLPV